MKKPKFVIYLVEKQEVRRKFCKRLIRTLENYKIKYELVY